MGKKLDRPVKAELDDFGREVGDSVPMSPPIGYKRSPTIVELIRQQIRSEQLRAEAEMAGAESFEESDDFDVDDDEEVLPKGYEIVEIDGRNAEVESKVEAPPAVPVPAPVAAPDAEGIAPPPTSPPGSPGKGEGGKT